MYTFITSYVKPNFEYKRWREFDISQSSLDTIFSDYEEIYVVLDDPFMVEPEILNLNHLKTLSIDRSRTLQQFLIDNADNALPTQKGKISLTHQDSKYADGFRAGYTITPVTQTGHSDDLSPLEDKTWLLLEKPDLDYSLFGRHCLVSVNGFLHYSETSQQGIFVKDAMKSNFHCGYSTLGIISFKGLSQVQQVPITREMIKSFDTFPLEKKAVIELNTDISNHTLLLSLGGYLVLPATNVISRLSENTFVIDFTNYSLANRFFESRQYLDYSDFELDTPVLNPDQYTIDELISEDFIIKLLTMSQSFVILLDNPDIYFEEHNVRPSPMPGIYTSYIKPLYPLILGEGMMGNYWYTFQKPWWSLNVIDGLVQNRVYNSTEYLDELSIDNSRESNNPVNWSRAYYLKMSADILEIKED